MTIVNYSKELINCILNLTKPQTKHSLNLISALINFEGKKNLSNLNRNLLSTTNRSNLKRVLTFSPWDDEELNKKRLDDSYDKLLENLDENNSPLFLSTDDTLISKSKSTKHMEGFTKLLHMLLGSTKWLIAKFNYKVSQKTYLYH